MKAGRATCALPGCSRTVANKGRRPDGGHRFSRYCRRHESPESRELVRVGAEYALRLWDGRLLSGRVETIDLENLIVGFMPDYEPKRLWYFTAGVFGYCLERAIHSLKMDLESCKE